MCLLAHLPRVAARFAKPQKKLSINIINLFLVLSANKFNQRNISCCPRPICRSMRPTEVTYIRNEFDTYELENTLCPFFLSAHSQKFVSAKEYILVVKGTPRLAIKKNLLSRNKTFDDLSVSPLINLEPVTILSPVSCG